MLSKFTDEYLITEVQACNNDKYAELIDRYRERLTNYAYKLIFRFHFRDLEIEVEEAVSETLLRTLVNLKIGKPKDPKCFNSYIHSILRNYVIDKIRQKDYQHIRQLDENIEKEYHSSLSISINEEIIKKDYLDIIYKNLLSGKEFKMQDKQIILFHFKDGKEVKEISELLKINDKHVYYILEKFKKSCIKLFATEN